MPNLFNPFFSQNVSHWFEIVEFEQDDIAQVESTLIHWNIILEAAEYFFNIPFPNTYASE